MHADRHGLFFAANGREFPQIKFGRPWPDPDYYIEFGGSRKFMPIRVICGFRYGDF
jgi:hypothetical protein